MAKGEAELYLVLLKRTTHGPADRNMTDIIH